jgi:hypothetical protein
LILFPVIISHIYIFIYLSCTLINVFPSGHHFISIILFFIFHYFIISKLFKLYIRILPLIPPVTIYYFYSSIFNLSIQKTASPNLISGCTPKLAFFISALLNLVPTQYDLSNITFCKLALLKFVFYNNEDVISACGILILEKFRPENNGLYILTAVIAAAALFDIDLLVLVCYTIFIII